MIYGSRFVLTVALAALVTATALAQPRGRGSGGEVTGVVVDSTTGEPVEAATVALRTDVDSSVVRGAITNGEGQFTLERVRPGAYNLRVSYVGYREEIVDAVSVSQENPSVDVGEIQLAQITQEMDEVEVSAEREYMEVQADRNIYHPQRQAVTMGGSAQDVLQEIPSVEVDMEGNISLRGSEGVRIFLNGRPAPMQGQALAAFLEGLSASDVKRVEVIPNPSAAYDPEGTSGIINIVLEEDTDRGFGGGISGGANTNREYDGSINAHYGEGPWGLFANYSIRTESDEDYSRRIRANLFQNPISYLEQDGEETETGYDHNFNNTIEYSFNKSNTLALRSVVSLSDEEQSELTTYMRRNADSVITSRYNRDNTEEQGRKNLDLRLTYDRIIKAREHELSGEIGFDRQWESSDEYVVQQDLALDGSGPIDEAPEDEQWVDQSEGEREIEARIDYERPLPLGDDGGLEIGYESEFEYEGNDYFSRALRPSTGNVVPLDSLNNAFNYNSTFHSLYSTTSGSLWDFNLQLGLRLERAVTDLEQVTLGETYGNSYFSLFPSVHLTYEPTQSQTFNVSYSKRVERPNSWQLNPYGDYTDPTFRRVGNPELLPEYTHSMEVGFTQLGEVYTISLSPYYRHTVDAISWHEEITDDGVSILTFENYATENSFGVELIGSLSWGDRLKANGSFNAFKRQTDASNVRSSLSNDALGYTTRLRLTATIVEGLQLQISQFYRSGHDIAGGRIGSFQRTNVALRQQLLGERASLSLRGSDLLGDSSFDIQRRTARFYQEYHRTRDSRMVELTFRYNFGERQDDRRDRGGDRGGGGGNGDGGGAGGYGM